MMGKTWIYRGQPGWRELRVTGLLKGLQFAESIGDMQVCRIIIREIRRVILL